MRDRVRPSGDQANIKHEVPTSDELPIVLNGHDQVHARVSPAELSALVAPSSSATLTAQTIEVSPSQARTQDVVQEAHERLGNPAVKWLRDAYSQFGGASALSLGCSVTSFLTGVLLSPVILTGQGDPYANSFKLVLCTGAAFWTPFFVVSAWQDRKDFANSETSKFDLKKTVGKVCEYAGVWGSSELWYTPARTAFTGILLKSGLEGVVANAVSQGSLSVFYISAVPIIRKINSDLRKLLTRNPK